MTTPDFINHGKMWFDVPPMKHQPRLFVVHYTAGEGPAAQIPRALPLEAVTEHESQLQVRRSEIPHAQLFAGPGSKLFKGVCGHSHVPSKSGKVDPGPRILDELAAYWGLL